MSSNADSTDIAQALLGNVAAELLDVDGRPLGEIAAQRYRSTPTELVPCPYDDGRRGLPMSRSALVPLLTVWPQALALLRRLAGPATVGAAWQACLAINALPLWLPEPIPRVHSAAYRAGLGYGQVLAWLLLAEEGMVDRPLSSLGDGRQFHAWLAAEGWLKGHEQVCAGPPALIAVVLDTLASPGPALPPAVSTWMQALAAQHAVHAAHVYAARAEQWRGRSIGPSGDALLTSGRALLHAVLRHPYDDPQLARRLLSSDMPAHSLEVYFAAQPSPETAFQLGLTAQQPRLDAAALAWLVS